MASAAPPPQPAPQNDSAPAGSQPGAKKKNKKKKAAQAKANAAAAAAAGAAASPTEAAALSIASSTDARDDRDKPDADMLDKPDDASVKGTQGPKESEALASQKAETNGNGHVRKASEANGRALPTRTKQAEAGSTVDEDGDKTEETAAPPSHHKHKSSNGNALQANHAAMAPDAEAGADGSAAALRSEVERLRQQVQALQAAAETHAEETEQLRAELEESETGREQAQTQYHNLLGRVEKIKETLGERLKRDKQELEEAKDRIEELETQNEALRQGGEAAEAEAERLQEALAATEREQNALRGRSQLSQQNWQREKEELGRQLQQVRAELESTSGAMGEWEVIAMEERSVRESLTEKAADLEDQLAAVREQHERVVDERDTQAQAVDSLQRALQEIQEARKHELREMVESSEAQLEAARAEAQKAEAAAEAAVAEATSLRQELERTLPFEKEVKEKNLLIGKLRHETIVLNDHLTKALRYIKKNKPEENVDRQVVTNHLLQFLALDRSDPKKFQILQVIAGVLNWTEEQKEKVGLVRPGTSSSSLRLPSSPFHRTPSTPSLNAEFYSEPTSARESLADLWAGFLERSVEEASESSGPPSRKDSLPRG